MIEHKPCCIKVLKAMRHNGTGADELKLCKPDNFKSRNSLKLSET